MLNSVFKYVDQVDKFSVSEFFAYSAKHWWCYMHSKRIHIHTNTHIHTHAHTHTQPTTRYYYVRVATPISRKPSFDRRLRAIYSFSLSHILSVSLSLSLTHTHTHTGLFFMWLVCCSLCSVVESSTQYCCEDPYCRSSTQYVYILILSLCSI